jgi:hypothetical protein
VNQLASIYKCFCRPVRRRSFVAQGKPFWNRKSFEELGKGEEAFGRKASHFSTTVRRIKTLLSNTNQQTSLYTSVSMRFSCAASMLLVLRTRSILAAKENLLVTYAHFDDGKTTTSK